MSDIGHPEISARSVSAVIERLRAMPRNDTPRNLSPAALAAAEKHPPPAISPIVLAGMVRMAEFLLILLVGFAIYAKYVLVAYNFGWNYAAVTGAIAVLSIVAFQAADIYQIQAFRGYERQYMRLAAAWSLVFLAVMAAAFFLKAGEQFSRIWLGSFYVVGLLTLLAFRRIVFVLVRRWTKAGYLTLRTVIVGGGDAGAGVIDALARQKNLGLEIIGLFDDRGDSRSGSECAGQPKLGSVDDLVEFGRRTRVDLVIFSLPITRRGAHSRHAEEALGAAGRHPSRCARQQAAIPPALLLVYRQRAGDRCRRPADRRLGRGDEMAVRQSSSAACC